MLKNKHLHRLIRNPLARASCIVAGVVAIAVISFWLGITNAPKPVATYVVGQTVKTDHSSGAYNSVPVQAMRSSHGQFTLYGTVVARTKNTVDVKTPSAQINGMNVSSNTTIIDPTHRIKTTSQLKAEQAATVTVSVQRDGALVVERIALSARLSK